MSARILFIASTALALTACATSQNNPVHQTTKYKSASPYNTASYGGSTERRTIVYGGTENGGTDFGQTIAASTPTAVYTYPASTPGYTTSNPGTGYTRVDESCLSKEKTHKLIGTTAGGAAGAFAGNKLVGGTKGTILGAAVGGAAGYGLGDKSVHCDPVSMPVSHTNIVTQPYQQTTQYSPQPTTYTAPTDRQYTGTGIGTPGYNAIHGTGGAAAAQPVYKQPVPTYVRPTPTYAQTTPRQNIYVQPRPTLTPTPTATASAPLGAGLQHIVVEGDTVYRMSKNLCVTTEEIQRLNNLDASFNIKVGQTIFLPRARC